MEETFRREQMERGVREDMERGVGKERVVERFERELREMGAERWMEVHFEFEMLPNRAIGLSRLLTRDFSHLEI